MMVPVYHCGKYDSQVVLVKIINCLVEFQEHQKFDDQLEGI